MLASPNQVDWSCIDELSVHAVLKFLSIINFVTFVERLHHTQPVFHESYQIKNEKQGAGPAESA